MIGWLDDWMTGQLGAGRQATINDLPVGRSVDEALRLVKAFQFNVRVSPPPLLPLASCVKHHVSRITN